MNKLVYSALAMTIVGAPGTASEDWLSLDQEIESLSASLSSQGNGPGLSGWVLASYRNSSDIETFVTEDGDNDGSLSGFTLDSIRLNVSGDVDEYHYMVSYDMMTISSELQDAYVRTDIGDTVSLTAGQFRQPFLRSGLIDRNRTLFQDRTALGDYFATRQPGVMLGGNFDMLDWHIAAQNGVNDGAGEELLLTGRVSVDLMGDGCGMVEGAYGAGDDTNVTVGVSLADDSFLSDGQHFSVDGTITSGPFSGSVELVDFDDGSDTGVFGPLWIGVPGAVIDSSNTAFPGSEVAGTTPWAATVSYMITPDEYEIAFRYEDSDNDNDETVIRVGINRYVSGHDIKWHLGWTSFETDNVSLDDIDMITLGLGLSF
jgi:hypothetical protein